MQPKKSHSEIKKTIVFLIIFLGIGIKTNSQTTAKKEQSVLPNVEKIYLHTDRNYYIIGESLWYKAYLVYAYTNILFDNSKLLYVELIDPDGNIIANHKTYLEAGLGNGDFKLNNLTGVKKAGTYQLRAYTNWSRNFEHDFVFKKEIEILDVFKNDLEKKDLALKKKKKLDNEQKESAKNKVKVQFFPEGGSLIEDVTSSIAFKAIDLNGFPKKVRGKIFDANNNLITLFTTAHDGMGKFNLKPSKGVQYYAILTDSHEKIPLPKPIEQGYVLCYKKIKEKDIITVKTNKKTLLKHANKPVTIVCKTRGVTYFEGSQPIPKTSLSFELPKTNFPEGICQITLYDSNAKPQSERLVYIKKQQDLNVTLTTHKKSYQPEEKVFVKVSSTNLKGDAVLGSFSLSSADTNGLKTQDYEMNICSYFLIQSDIKGKVHNPGYYFNDANPNRIQALDLLLLTQGWRDFLWKTLPKVKDSISYGTEKGITISGKVKQLLGKKPKAYTNISLTLINDKGLLGSTFIENKTDSIGLFEFKNLVFKGKTNALLNAKDKKGRNRGMFILDSIQLPPLVVNFKDAGIIYKTDNTSIKEKVYDKYIQFGVPNENTLNEVTITSTKKTEEPPSIYGNADHTYVVNDKTMRFNDVFQMIQFTIPSVTVRNGTIGFARLGGGPVLVMIDGAEYPQSELAGITVDDIAKIKAFKGPSAAIFGSRGGNGVIVIYSKNGKITTRATPKFHSIKQKVEGFYNARVFYAPDLKNPSDDDFLEDPSLDIRNTLYWNPYMFPNEIGEAQATYYNSKVETQVKVTLEGITATGIPVVKHTYYNIEK